MCTNSHVVDVFYDAGEELLSTSRSGEPCRSFLSRRDSMMLLPVVLLLFGGASVTEGFPAVTTNDQLILQYQRISLQRRITYFRTPPRVSPAQSTLLML